MLLITYIDVRDGYMRFSMSFGISYVLIYS